MATKKKMLQAAAGNAGGGAGLNVEDVFSSYVYEGNGSSQVIENGINLGQSFGSGSVKFSDGTDAANPAGLDFSSSAELALSDFTVEGNFYIENNFSISSFACIGTYQTGLDIRIYPSGPRVYLLGSTYSSTSSMSIGNWYHVAIVRTGSSLYVYIDGSRVNTHSVTSSSLPVAAGSVGGLISGSVGAGLNNRYISNFRISNTARYTGASFTVPTTDFTSDANTMILALQGTDPLTDASSYSRTLTKDTTAGNTITEETFGPFDAEEAGEGGLVWTKGRTQTVEHILVDTERGVQKYISSDRTNAEGTNSGILNSFNYNGFSIGGSSFVNSSGNDYASWTFRKAPKFFTCVEYTGTGSTGNTVSHSLGTTVGSIIIKRINNADDWCVYHRSDGATTSKFYRLNTSGAQDDFGVDWITVTQNDFTLNVTSSKVNAPANYVAYLFAHNDGDGEFGPDGNADIIKCGSYTGNGSANGPEIDLGFEPQWLLIKNTTSGTNWLMYDTMRGISTGGDDSGLVPNGTLAEYTSERLSVTSTGFSLNSTGFDSNANGYNYIYIAIRRGTKVPESASEVFDIADMSSFVNTHIVGITPDAALLPWRTTSYDDGTNSYPEMFDRLRGKGGLQTSNNRAENTGRNGAWDYMDRFTGVYGTGAWMWKRAPGFFDAVAYKSTTSAQTLNHNLSAIPEMMWIKNRDDSKDWQVYHSALGNTKYLQLNTTDAEATASNRWNNTSPTATQFTVGTAQKVNDVTTTRNYIAYLFASLPGISKVGSYTGNGSSSGQNIDCGFTTGARFILLKQTNGTSNWLVFDTERGITVGNDPYLKLDVTDVETTNPIVDPYSGGFKLQGTIWNGSGENYIFYAIA